MIKKLDIEHFANRQQQRQIRSWLKRIDDYPRIAEFLRNHSPERYGQLMQDTFDPDPRKNRLRVPRYLARLSHFQLSRILTTNFDRVLELALGPDWDSLTWQDGQDLVRYLQYERCLILHVHGRVNRFGTLVHTREEYERFKGTEGKQVRDFLQRIFETYTVLFMGYRMGDPVIRWLHDQIQADWDIRPDWYALMPNPSPDDMTREMQERNLQILPYSVPKGLSGPSADAAHEDALDEWFLELADHLDLADVSPRPRPGEEAEGEPAPGWTELTDDFLKQFDPPTQEAQRLYYRGEPPTWGLVCHGASIPRDAVGRALRALQEPGLRIVLLHGAGGEGKSTALMQVGLALREQGYRVWHAFEPEGDPIALLKHVKEPAALLVDGADLFQGLERLIRYAINEKRDWKVVLAARTHEWQASQQLSGDLKRRINWVPMGRLSEAEARALAERLEAAGAVVKGKVPLGQLAQQLVEIDSGRRFLLAAMLIATRGESLARIL